MSVRAARIAGQPPRHEVALCATGYSPQEMEDANARLIAAAPEMLAALCGLLDVFENDADADAAIDAARAAIVKAEGNDAA